MIDVGFNLTTDASPLHTGIMEASKLVGKLNAETKSFEAESKDAFKSSASEVDRYTKELADGVKQTGKMTEEVNKLGKTKNAVQQLKAEIKFYTAEAYKAGEGTKAFSDNLEKAGKLKDKLGDLNKQVQSLNGNLGENFARAAGNSIGIVSKGFEGVTALQVLAGKNNKAFEETLLRLQSLNALASISQEFAGLGDKITEIKLGVTNFVSGAGAALTRLWAVIVANPIGALVTAAVALGAAFFFLKDKAAAFFDSNVERLEKSISGTKEYLDLLEKEADFFIRRAELQGQDAYKKELQQLTEIRQTIKGKIADLNQLSRIEGELNDKQKELYDELVTKLESTNDKITLLQLQRDRKQTEILKETINAEKELRIAKINDEETREKAQAAKRRDDAIAKFQEDIQFLFTEAETEALLKDRSLLLNQVYNRELEEIEKKHAEKRLAKQKELFDAFAELTKRANAAEAEGLTGENKIAKDRENALKDLKVFKDQLEAKAKETDKNFKFNAEQLDQFTVLEQAIYRDETQKLLALQVERETALLNQKKALNEQNITALNQQEAALINGVEGSTKRGGVSTDAFEEAKQRQILDIQERYALLKLAAKKRSLSEEMAEEIKAFETRKALNENVNSEELQIIKNKYDLENQEINNATDKIINDIKKKREDLNNEHGFSLSKLLGVSDSDVQGFTALMREAGNAIDSFLQVQIKAREEEIKITEGRIADHDKEIASLEQKLETERRLSEDGKANNMQRLTDQLNEEKAARDQDLAEERRIKREKADLAKQQLIVDTIVQASNLAVAATQIYATIAKDPISTGIATATVIAMITAFAIQKAAAFDAVGKERDANSFADGVIDLQGPGTSKSDSINARLSKGESVMTAEETSDNLSLFKGIRTRDQRLINEGVLNLLKDTGVILTPEIPASFMQRRNDLRNSQINQYYPSENKALKAEIASLHSTVQLISKQTKNKTFVDSKGSTVKQMGSHTQIIRKNE